MIFVNKREDVSHFRYCLLVTGIYEGSTVSLLPWDGGIMI